MNGFVGLAPLAVAATLVTLGCLPVDRLLSNRRVMRLVQSASFVSLVISLLASLAWTLSQSPHITISKTIAGSFSIGTYFDSLTAVMLVLVSFVGYAVVKYSVRYMDGDERQGRFARSLSLTLGSVLVSVLASNLIMFFAAWVLTSFGLHQLLTFYASRPAAQLAARQKFLISRLGDVMLIAAGVLTFRMFGSWDYEVLFASASVVGEANAEGWSLTIIGVLFVLGAMTKSAQFPFHSWLPDTMETPTPVSALMHAGVINAGGFLVIRLSPILSQTHFALNLLAIVGAVTALFASVVMLTQTSVKRSLAYSTIAQMGLMMLQAGLGAFSAALLHIVAHSLYKAHAFLNSGSVIESSRETSVLPRRTGTEMVRHLAISLTMAGAIASGVVFSLSQLVPGKPGMLPLAVILWLSLTQMLQSSFAFGTLRLAMRGATTSIGVAAAYAVAWLAVDFVLARSFTISVSPLSWADDVVLAVVMIGFVSVFVLQALIQSHKQTTLMKWLYVQASNAFYIDIFAHKLTTRLWGSLAKS